MTTKNVASNSKIIEITISSGQKLKNLTCQKLLLTAKLTLMIWNYLEVRERCLIKVILIRE